MDNKKNFATTSFRIRADLKKAFKVAVAARDTDQSTVVNKAIEDWLLGENRPALAETPPVEPRPKLKDNNEAKTATDVALCLEKLQVIMQSDLRSAVEGARAMLDALTELVEAHGAKAELQKRVTQFRGHEKELRGDARRAGPSRKDRGKGRGAA
jgi:hypothetical protein